jgi:hypothetical protein
MQMQIVKNQIYKCKCWGNKNFEKKICNWKIKYVIATDLPVQGLIEFKSGKQDSSPVCSAWWCSVYFWSCIIWNQICVSEMSIVLYSWEYWRSYLVYNDRQQKSLSPLDLPSGFLLVWAIGANSLLVLGQHVFSIFVSTTQWTTHTVQKLDQGWVDLSPLQNFPFKTSQSRYHEWRNHSFFLKKSFLFTLNFRGQHRRDSKVEGVVT